MPDGSNSRGEQFTLADGEGHDWNGIGVYLSFYEFPVEVFIRISSNG